MRLQLLAFLLLVGCSSGGSPELPKQPEAPTDSGVVASVGKDLDKVDGRVAAAVKVANENSDKPAIVKAETGVALSYLPAPKEGDLAFARQRASKMDAKSYAEAEAYGKQLLAKVEAEWAKLESQQKEAKRVSELKDARIVELTKEIDRVKKDAAANLWTMAGVAVAVIGAIATAFTGPRIGLPLLLCGGAIGAFPFVIESEYFTWIASAFTAACAALGIWVVWDKARDKVNESDKPEEPK